MAGPSCAYTDVDVCMNDEAFGFVEGELLGGLSSDLLASSSMEDVFAEYDALAFTTPDLSLSASSDDLLCPSDVVDNSKGCTAAAADALRSCSSQWQTAVSMMVTGTWSSSASTSSAASKDDTMTDGEGAEQRPQVAAPVANTTPRSIRKVRGRRTNRQRGTTPPHAADALHESGAAAAPAAPVNPSAAAVEALLVATSLPQATDQQAGHDLATMSGVLRPFDAVKDYRTAGTMTLQQLNARIRGSCLLL